MGAITQDIPVNMGVLYRMVTSRPPVELYDKFNDLPFFPVQKAGMYSDGIKKYAAKNDIVDKVKEVNTPKLICDLVPRRKYLVHYSLLQLGLQQGLSRHAHPPPHSIQTSTLHL